MQDPTKKRRHPRLPVSITVEGEWWSAGSTERQPFSALMVALSEGGVMLHTAAAVPANSAVELVFRLTLLKRFKPRGVVRWWRRKGEVRELGIQFDQTVPALGVYVREKLGLPPAPQKAATK